MKYYLRKMHGCSVSRILLQIPDKCDPPKLQEDSYYSWSLSFRVWILNKNNENYESYWYRGEPEGSSAGSRMGGHHLGECSPISEEEAEKILMKMRQDELDKLVKEIRDNECDIDVSWTDEYGGMQGVFGGVKLLVKRDKNEK